MNNDQQLTVSQPAQMSLADMQVMAKLFADSGMFPNVNSMAKAFIKIQAGIELGIAPFASMSGIHIIKEKATVGAGLMAGKIKASGKYDYKIVEHTDKKCVIDFFEGGQKQGTETFTIEDAKKAGTQNLEKFPKNMLFARAISNGMKFYCPDLYTMPVYTPEEMKVVVEDVTHEEVKTAPVPQAAIAAPIKKVISAKQLDAAIIRISNGELDIMQKIKDSFSLSADQLSKIEDAEKKGEELKSAIDNLSITTTEQDVTDFKSQLPVYIVENASFVTAPVLGWKSSWQHLHNAPPHPNNPA